MPPAKTTICPPLVVWIPNRGWPGWAISARSLVESLNEAAVNALFMAMAMLASKLGRTGTALDNAMADSFVSTLKAELVSRFKLPTRQAVRTTIFEYLETFYSTRRLHSRRL
jgi:transposase InsO family protein